MEFVELGRITYIPISSMNRVNMPINSYGCSQSGTWEIKVRVFVSYPGGNCTYYSDQTSYQSMAHQWSIHKHFISGLLIDFLANTIVSLNWFMKLHGSWDFWDPPMGMFIPRTAAMNVMVWKLNHFNLI